MRWAGLRHYRLILLIVLLAVFAISAIRPRYPADFVWEHLLTVAALAFFGWLEWKRRPLSNVSYTLIFIYLSVHILGAHYTYSEVPYDEWARSVTGRSVSEWFGQSTDRNHFDRLVHFSFGVLMMHPMRELVQRWIVMGTAGALVIAASLLVTMGTLYELFEWMYATFAGAEAAEHYNGQQGDMFDAQKDIALNVMGMILGAMVSAVAGRP